MFSTTILILVILFAAPSYQSNEKELITHLTKDYSPFARPVKDGARPVDVTLGFELIHVVRIIEATQTFICKVWLRMSWVNEYMTWSPVTWGNITSTRLSDNMVWTPDIFIQEDVSSDMSSGPTRYKTSVTMLSDGTHKWNIPTLLHSSCNFDVTDFPFDRQRCTLKFLSWTHDEAELNITKDPKSIITTNYINSTEWDLVGVVGQRNSRKYNCCANPFVDLTYIIELDRKPLYYFYNVVIPCIIQMSIILITFWLPPDCGDRIGVSITVLLVFAVYLEVLSASLPKTSTSTPALSRFYLAAMAESAMSIMATCFVLVIHFKGAEKGIGPMPGWVRNMFLNKMAKYVLVRRNLRVHDDNELLAIKKQQSKGEGGMFNKNSKASFGIGNGISKAIFGIANNVNSNSLFGFSNVNSKSLFSLSNENSKSSLIRADRNPLFENEAASVCDEDVSMGTIVEEVRKITSLIHDQNLQDEIEEEWQSLAKVFDRIFFLLFLFVYVVSGLIILLPVHEKNITAH